MRTDAQLWAIIREAKLPSACFDITKITRAREDMKRFVKAGLFGEEILNEMILPKDLESLWSKIVNKMLPKLIKEHELIKTKFDVNKDERIKTELSRNYLRQLLAFEFQSAIDTEGYKREKAEKLRKLEKQFWKLVEKKDINEKDVFLFLKKLERIRG